MFLLWWKVSFPGETCPKTNTFLLYILYYTYIYVRIYILNNILAKQPPSAAFPSLSESAAFGSVSKTLNFFCVPILTQMVLELPLYHEGSEYVLSFEIGQRQGGFYSRRTDTPSTSLVYRYTYIYYKECWVKRYWFLGNYPLKRKLFITKETYTYISTVYVILIHTENSISESEMCNAAPVECINSLYVLEIT